VFLSVFISHCSYAYYVSHQFNLPLDFQHSDRLFGEEYELRNCTFLQPSVSTCCFFLFFSFFLLTLFCLLVVDVEGYCCIWSQPMTLSVGLLWRRDRPVAETPTWQNTEDSQERDIDAHRGIRTRNSSKWMAADLRLRPRGHWDRLLSFGTKYSYQHPILNAVSAT
jgi:hypothetical protein